MKESYRHGLDVDELLCTAARLLRARRRTGALLCLQLADLADGLLRRPGLALFYRDVYQLARRRLSPDAKQLLEPIKGGKLGNVVTLSTETGMPLPRLIAALTDLELAHLVARDPVGFYEVVRGSRRWSAVSGGPGPHASSRRSSA